MMSTVKAKKIDATQGSLIPLIISFVIPLIFMTLIQKLFNAVDIAILGSMADTSAVASVGATTTITHLVVDCFVGIAAGAKIVFSHLVGKNDTKDMQRTLDTSVITAAVLGAVVAVLGYFLTPVLLRVVNCPADCFDGAVLYMRIYLLAAPAILVYNLGSAILTSWGDTRRPLYYAIASGLLNVVLNVILCFVLREKVAAVAIATAASQLLSAILVIRRLCHMEGDVRFRFKQIHVSGRILGKIVRFGVPVALTNLIYPVANLQVASAINSYGVAAIAGNSASQTVEEMLASCRIAFGTASVTFLGQNLGAEKPERVRNSFFHILWIGVSLTAVLGSLLVLLSPGWLPLFLGSDTVAAEYATTRLSIMMSLQFISAANAVFANALTAFGYPIFGTLNTMVWVLGFRVFWMNVVYPILTSYASLIWCFVLAWICTLVFYVIIFAVIYRRYRKGKYKNI